MDTHNLHTVCLYWEVIVNWVKIVDSSIKHMFSTSIALTTGWGNKIVAQSVTLLSKRVPSKFQTIMSPFHNKLKTYLNTSTPFAVNRGSTVLLNSNLAKSQMEGSKAQLQRRQVVQTRILRSSSCQAKMKQRSSVASHTRPEKDHL